MQSLKQTIASFMYLYINDSVMDWNDELCQDSIPSPTRFSCTFLDPLSLLYCDLGQANQKRRNILNEQYSGIPLYEHL